MGMGGGGHANNPTFMFQVSEATVTLRAPAKSATARQFFFGAGAWARGYGGGPACAHASRPRKQGLTAARTTSPVCLLSLLQSDFAKNKWKGGVFVASVTILGIWVPWKCVSFAQKKAGVW